MIKNKYETAKQQLINLEVIGTNSLARESILIDYIESEASAIISDLGYDQPYYQRQGFQVITTLDQDYQRYADEIFKYELENAIGEQTRPDDFHAGLLSIESETGAIQAMRLDWRHTDRTRTWQYLTRSAVLLPALL